MEDFLELMHTHQKYNIKDAIINYSEDSPMREVCGFICKDGESFLFEEVINHSKEDQNFLIKPIDYLSKKLQGNLVAIFHSHTKGGSELSKHDFITSCNLLMPFVIYSLESKKFSVFYREEFQIEENCVKRLKENLGIND